MWTHGLLLALALIAQTPTNGLPEGAFVDSIDVRLVTVRLAALDARDQPILGLGPGDFSVTIDGEPVEVVAVDWLGSTPAATAATVDEAPPDGSTTRLGPLVTTPRARHDRLVVFFAQNDFDPSRLVGFVRLKRSYRRLIDALDPAEPAAVVVFQTHLELRQDFTLDRDRLEDVLRTAHHQGLGRSTEPPPSPPKPALGRYLTADDAAAVVSVEGALELLARQLDRLPGEKAIVLLGHGFGEMFRGRLLMAPGYEAASEALVAANVPVFGLDVTYASSHSQAAGFQRLARETGGTYHATAYFPEKAVRQVGHVLAGRYVLTLSGVEVVAGRHDLDIRLVSRRGRLVVQPARILATR